LLGHHSQFGVASTDFGISWFLDAWIGIMLLRLISTGARLGTIQHAHETVSIRAQPALRGTVYSFLREGCMATKFCIDLTQACGDMM